MKKFLIAMGVIFAIGFSLTIVGGLVGGFNIMHWQNDEIDLDSIEYETITYNGVVNSIDFEVEGTVQFIMSDSDEVKIVYPKYEKFIVEKDFLNENLSFELERYKSFLSIGENQLDKLVTKIYLPKNVLGEVELKAIISSGEISDLTCQNFNLDIISGEIKVENLNAKDVELEQVSGEVDISNLTAKTVKIDAVSAKVFIDKMTTESDVLIEKVSGKGDFSNLNIGGNFSIDSVSGGNEVNNATVFGDITIQSVSGGVDVLLLKSGNIDIDVVSGGVDLKINGDMQSHSVTGDSVVTIYENDEIVYEFKGDFKVLNGENKINVSSVSGKTDIYFNN